MKRKLSLFTALILVLTLILPFAPAADVSAEPGLVLASCGNTEYKVVIGENASPVEVSAADILVSYLERITSAEFPVIRDSEQESAKEIAVGVTNREAASPVDREGMGDDGVRIFTSGEKLFLTGGEKRGALYAVYTFLEEYLGCRWFTKSIPLTPDMDDLTVVPEAETLSIGGIDYKYVPPFVLRQTYWMFSTMYADYSSIHRLHGMMAGIPEELGGNNPENSVNAVHTMQWIITADMFAEHPEYFGCDDSGARTVNRQPCFSNEDVFRITLEAAKNHCATQKSIFSVSQNDGMDFCRCPECTAFNAAHGGVDSASMLNFANRIAAEVRKDYPDARIETLAYQATETPPAGLTVEDNLIIRVCPINTCVLHDLDDKSCPANAKFDKNLSGWSALTDRIYVWDYSTNFQYIYALYPNINSIGKRYQYFRDRNAIAIFDNGCGENVVPGELHELRTYLVCKLLWDPDTDVQKHIREFCDAYYGEAASDVIDFINYFEKAVKGFNLLNFKTCHMTCQDGGESLENNSSLTEIDVLKLDSILKKAASRDLTGQQAKRLYGLELSWRFYKNATWAGEFNWFVPGTDPAGEAEKLYGDMKEYGVSHLAEGGALPLDQAEPNFLVRPTFWFKAEDDLPSSVRIQSVLYPIMNKILRILFPIATLIARYRK